MVRQDDNPARAHREKQYFEAWRWAAKPNHQIARNKGDLHAWMELLAAAKGKRLAQSNPLTGSLMVLYGLTKRGSVESYRANFPKVGGVAGAKPPFSGRRRE
jgi:hypothetical protein